MKKHTIILLIGIALFVIGFLLNQNYEESTITVTGTITSIDTKYSASDDVDPYRHIYYGTYTVDGKEYTDKKIHSNYSSSSSPDHYVGETMDVRVNREQPGKETPEGGLFGVIGLLVTIYGIVVACKERKKEKQAASQQ